MSNNKSNYKLPIKVPFIFRLIHNYFPVLERVATPLANKLTVFIFFSPMRFKPPEKENEAYEMADKNFIIAAGKKVQIYVWGEGPSVLMTHGWSGRGTQFRNFIKPFNKAGYRVVSFDGPAHGKSSGRKTNIIEFLEVIRQLERIYGPFAGAIGHSFGGVANLYAHTQGVNIPKMIMISSPTITDDIINESIRKLNGSPERGTYLKNYILKKFGVPFEEVGALRLIEEVKDTPLLLIHDIEDREVSISHPKVLQKKYPTAHLIKTEGLGHIRILKNTDVIKYCQEFIEKDRKSILPEQTGEDNILFAP